MPTTLTPVVLAVLALTIAAFAAQTLGVVNALDFAQINVFVWAGQWWRLLSVILLHGDFFHLLFNMYALTLFGPAIERAVGSVPFAGLYLASGLLGSTAYLILGEPRVPVVGASGAIFGLFGAWIATAYRSRSSPAGASHLKSLLVLLAINMALPLVIPSIAWQAHLGGLVAGLVIGLAWSVIPIKRRGTTVRLAVPALVALLCVPLALLAAAH